MQEMVKKWARYVSVASVRQCGYAYEFRQHGLTELVVEMPDREVVFRACLGPDGDVKVVQHHTGHNEFIRRAIARRVSLLRRNLAVREWVKQLDIAPAEVLLENAVAGGMSRGEPVMVSLLANMLLLRNGERVLVRQYKRVYWAPFTLQVGGCKGMVSVFHNHNPGGLSLVVVGGVAIWTRLSPGKGWFKRFMEGFDGFFDPYIYGNQDIIDLASL